MRQYSMITAFIYGLITYTAIHAHGQSILPGETNYINVDGAALYVRSVGNGEPIIIVHGGPGMSHDYLAPRLIDLLADDYRLIFYDQRASGRSSGVEDTSRLTIAQFAEDLEMLRQHLNINRLNLLGHSFGGLLAMYYAASYPDNTNRLLLIDTSPASWELNFPHFRKILAERRTESDNLELSSIKAKEDFETNPDLMDRYLKIYFKPFFKDPLLSQQLTLGIDEKWISNFNVTNDRVWGDLAGYDIHDKLTFINASTLIMHGDESVIAVEGAQAINSHISGSQLVILKDVGHFPFIEDPGTFKHIVKTFIVNN